MRSLIVVTTFLLCSRSCFCESKTVEVQSGETVTLLCSDFTASRVQTDWFRVVNGTEVSCISSIFSSDGDPSFCDGFDGVKFEMNSNSSSVSLKISGVDESDSGLYFCGFYRNRHTVIGDVTQLIIKGDDEPKDKEKYSTFCVKHPYTSLLTVILAVLMGFSIFGALGLVVIFKHHCAAKENLHTDSLKTQDSSDPNSAAHKFSKSRKNGRPAENRKLETCVMYSVRRKTYSSV
ncbi:uncharacterized protein LOC110014534 [Oryzias latipes]